MLNLAIIIGSTRPGRLGESVARWVFEIASQRTDAGFELIDLKTFDLPLLDEPVPAGISRNYTQEHTKRWSQTIQAFDGFIFVTPEYNFGVPGALKNAIDFLYYEWNHKSAGFVGYGGSGGARSIDQFRSVMATLKIADVGTQVGLSLFNDFENFRKFKPNPSQEQSLNKMLDEVILWGEALKTIRMKKKEKAA